MIFHGKYCAMYSPLPHTVWRSVTLEQPKNLANKKSELHTQGVMVHWCGSGEVGRTSWVRGSEKEAVPYGPGHPGHHGHTSIHWPLCSSGCCLSVTPQITPIHHFLTPRCLHLETWELAVLRWKTGKFSAVSLNVLGGVITEIKWFETSNFGENVCIQGVPIQSDAPLLMVKTLRTILQCLDE